MADSTINLPTGFVLESAPKQRAGLPDGFVLEDAQMNLPEGFVLETPKKRGLIGEAGMALGRGFINLGQAAVGAGEKLFTQPPENIAKLGGTWSPRRNTAEEQLALKQKFQNVQNKMESARSDMAPTWSGLSGWAVNTLGEGAPYLAATIGSGGTVGPIGPIMIGFTMGGEAAYKKAIADGASEDRAMAEYASQIQKSWQRFFEVFSGEFEKTAVERSWGKCKKYHRQHAQECAG